MVGMLMSSSKLFLFSHEAHLNSGPVHPYSNIFENGDFFPYLQKNPRPQEYDRHLVWRAFSKTSIFVVENAVYVWAGSANGEKKSPFFENIRICADGASGVRLLVELYCVIVVKHVAFFAVCATLTMAVTLTSLLLRFCSSVSGCGCGFRFEQKYLRIDGFGQKKGTDLHTPIHSPLQWIKRRYHLSPLGLATVNPVVLTGVKICSGFH